MPDNEPTDNQPVNNEPLEQAVAETPQPESPPQTAPETSPTPDFTATEPRTPPASPELAITKPIQPKGSSKKKWLIILLVILLLAGGAAAAYFLVLKKDDPAPATNTPVTQTQPQQEAKKELKLDTVSYAFRSNDSAPFELFWRPASSGDKTKVTALPPQANISQSAVYKNKVVYTLDSNLDSNTGASIWFSEDGGKNFKEIFKETGATNVNNLYEFTSIIFSSDGSSLVYGYLPTNGKNQVTKLDLTSSNYERQVLFSNDSRGVFLHGYNAAQKKLIYSEGCYGCGGNLDKAILLRDLATNTNTELISSSDTKIVIFEAVNDDFSEILITQKTIDKSLEIPDIIGYYLGPPYTLSSVKLNGNAVTEMGQFGEKLTPEALVNGDPFSSAGYMPEDNTPYFAYKNQIFAIKNNSKTVIFESTKDLLDTPFVGNENIITSSGSFDNFILNNYNVKDKSNQTILTGDVNTKILGVTYTY